MDNWLKKNKTLYILIGLLALIVFSFTSEYKNAQALNVQQDMEVNLLAGDVSEEDALSLEEVDVELEVIEEPEVIKKTIIETKTIQYDVEYREDPNIDKGTTKVLKEGQDGKKELHYIVTFADNEEVARELVEEKVVKEPQNKVILKGANDRIRVGSASRSFRNSMIMESTAYTHTGNPTSTGKMPKRGTAAVDPNVIPLGKEIYVEGYGIAVAEDVGQAIKGNKIDLFMETEEEALKWGRKNVKVYVLD